MIRKTFVLTLCALCAAVALHAQEKLWIRYDDRFKANGEISLENVDSFEVRNTSLKLYNATLTLGYSTKTYTSLIPTDAADMMFTDPGRYLLKPNTYGGTDYLN